MRTFNISSMILQGTVLDLHYNGKKVGKARFTGNPRVLTVTVDDDNMKALIQNNRKMISFSIRSEDDEKV